MIYLDHAATTPCAEEVVQAMLPYFREQFANASSIDHIPGVRAREAVERAREQIAALVGSQPEDVIFTSGSTEANNLALSVTIPVITTRLEHPSVLDAITARKNPADSFVGCNDEGLVIADELRAMLGAESLVSVIATNNETGVEQDLDALATLVNESAALLHLDATQAIGTRSIEVRKRGIGAASISAHKIQGPKGIGALVTSGDVRRKLTPMIHGGGHERGFRSGTLNVPGIVGFGVAAELALKHREDRRRRLEELRDLFIDATNGILGTVTPTISSAATSPHILSLRLKGVNARALLRAVRGEVAFSLGSACATNKAEPSHVLLALGAEKKAIAETIRCSFSSDQSVTEIQNAATTLAKAAKALSAYSLPA